MDGVENRLSKTQHISLGQRAFEIVMARKMAAGELQTTWFARHGSTPIVELPPHWPTAYRRLVERRIELIETNPHIALIEQPEYKRRWSAVPWEQQADEALREWLLDRLESYFDFDGRMNEDRRVEKASLRAPAHPTRNEKPRPLAEIALASVARLADVARRDGDFMQVAEFYRDDPAFDVQALVAELVESESVPLLPVLRYKPSGLRKRAQWERVWHLQREEDAAGKNTITTKHTKHTKKEGGEEQDNAGSQPAADSDSLFRVFGVFRGSIPVPPKYSSADFLKSDYWRLRGKLDVPKERWISFPHCEGPDGTLVIAWAGYDPMQLARSISAYYVEVQERLGGRDDPRLVPLLACLIELLPWLKQWHNEPDAQFDGMRMGDYFEGFVQEEARQLGKTLDEIKAWQPPAARPRRKARR
ncbi:MAG TPA: BREX-2 system adenine-specific DNA-methyltransferase PglX [Pirellulales bacterium]|nr:BREX-2 system adenine-specific DNA-methyltransferase PglX [Pirellulales bacterium]